MASPTLQSNAHASCIEHLRISPGPLLAAASPTQRVSVQTPPAENVDVAKRPEGRLRRRSLLHQCP
eukprot:6367922-Prorocentrum_lima.AAC.1